MSIHYPPRHPSRTSQYAPSPGPNRPQSAHYGAPPPQQYYGAPEYNQAPHHSGRYSAAPTGPPAGADPQLWQWFSAVDTDRSRAISVNELQAALVNGNWSRFDLDTVKMLMSMFDTNRSGTIQFNEFSGLWKYIEDWQAVFRHFDTDRSGSIEGRELAEALKSFGYNLSPTLLSLVEEKYGYGPPPGITFDRFVRACVVVKTLTESFQRIDTDRDGWVQINYEQFMKIVLSAP